jgi:excinuclease ABC subunit A
MSGNPTPATGSTPSRKSTPPTGKESVNGRLLPLTDPLEAKSSPTKTAPRTSTRNSKARPSATVTSPSAVAPASSSTASTTHDPGAAGWLHVRGARVHNLDDIDVSLPKGSLVVCCGLSGSGKSSLAFDTIFAEGQRRYVESLSAYARQFLGQLDKPDVDAVDGLSPAISIDQKSTTNNPRSTVGTVTEIWDHLRLLWARTADAHCPGCDVLLRAWSPAAVVDAVLARRSGTDTVITAPIVRSRKGTHLDVLELIASSGFARARIDGVLHRVGEVPPLEKTRNHTVEAVIDRLNLTPSRRRRIIEAVEQAFSTAGGLVTFVFDDEDTETFSNALGCVACGVSVPSPEPRTFSFNSPYGACDVCDGLGSALEVCDELLIPDPTKTLSGGAIEPWSNSSGEAHFQRLLAAVVAKHGGSMDVAWSKLPVKVRNVVLAGDPSIKVRTKFETNWESREYDASFEGVRGWLRRRLDDAWSDANRERMAQYFRPVACSSCSGTRLKPAARSFLIGGRAISDVASLTVADAQTYFSTLELVGSKAAIGSRVVKEIRERLSFLDTVGLGYLSLDRSATTLSGGEAQRIRLASQIGSGLTGVLYVLDEPSIGLHQRDNEALIATLERLRDLGNTVIVVEHDEDTIDAADWIVEIGPGAGELGGTVVYSGPREGFDEIATSVTAAYLTGRRSIKTPTERRLGNGNGITVIGASGNNLASVDARFPIGTLTAVTGVSGSGKSTLVNDILAAGAARSLHRSAQLPAAHTRIDGLDNIDKLVVVDQAPIGRTPRSNPATYTGVFDKIRELFSQTPSAKERGWGPGRFSFNVPARSGGGRCEDCQGEGTLKVEMNFLPDVWVTCEACDGHRYTEETLEITYKGKSIANVLGMPIAEATTFFAAVPSVARHMTTLTDVGLGYVRLGQPATTLSGGEAQRVKLASELLRRATGKTLYVLDEPTTGLHFDDVKRLVEVLSRLVDAGNTVVVIEHNLDVVRCADWVLDLGPEGGPNGGHIVAQGTPEAIAVSGTHTGRFLAKALTSAAARDRTQSTSTVV